jgi:hypothetical protein
MLREAPHQERDGVPEEQETPPARLALRARLPLRSQRETFALVKQGQRGLQENHHVGVHRDHLPAPWSFLEQRDCRDELR